ncbi:DUF5642 family protein [Candidatus Mycobacterium wuenschmannii]|uniref:DUF5642 family protein n=1 Tax=Candidatus Mycobacterium wuenschmannii TaxID=3027808 RepID=A0ABY8VS66_9MYCO|nr:DUF5642 family protein [Candidatus Mycobacterium wuenschmannii]WIM85776.1 DUF5642 family protein [Candidatus Mycobacterium wuenschmannii]
MRIAAAAPILLLLAGCVHPAEHRPAPSTTVSAGRVDPGNIRRVRRDLPPGYEVAPVADVVAPPGVWGLGGVGAATPARCGPLADPTGGRGQRAQGISGSGPGGTVYAVVVAAPTGPVALDHSALAGCRQWSMTGRRARAHVHVIDAPHVDAADTLGMAADIVTSVEGGNEIASRASTFTAYLGDYYAFTVLVSDPGSPNPALTPQFAADLLVKTVSAVRG